MQGAIKIIIESFYSADLKVWNLNESFKRLWERWFFTKESNATLPLSPKEMEKFCLGHVSEIGILCKPSFVLRLKWYLIKVWGTFFHGLGFSNYLSVFSLTRCSSRIWKNSTIRSNAECELEECALHHSAGCSWKEIETFLHTTGVFLSALSEGVKTLFSHFLSVFSLWFTLHWMHFTCENADILTPLNNIESQLLCGSCTYLYIRYKFRKACVMFFKISPPSVSLVQE